MGLLPTAALAQMADTVDVVGLRANLGPLSEVPPLTGVDAQGGGQVNIVVNRDATGAMISALVEFKVSVTFGRRPEMVRAMHIHRGAAGTNGPIVVNSGLGQPIEGRVGVRIFRQVEISDAAGLAVVAEILANPGDFYLNVHTASAPPGFVRGQLVGPNTFAADLSTQMGDVKTDTDALLARIQALESVIRQIGRRLGLVFE
ncbi:MAG: CHRD domain-containing protein [bacterium]|nr:CHRD domain-containing protein [bacterium]